MSIYSELFTFLKEVNARLPKYSIFDCEFKETSLNAPYAYATIENFGDERQLAALKRINPSFKPYSTIEAKVETYRVKNIEIRFAIFYTHVFPTHFYYDVRKKNKMIEDEDGHVFGKCENCGKECTSVTRDFGIGGYEYWGSVGNHVYLVEVSPCCEDEMIEIEEEDEDEPQ